MQIESEVADSRLNSELCDVLPLRSTWDAVRRFIEWLDVYGESSLDFQTYYSSVLGRKAKALYYRHRKLGILAVAPMVISEAIYPSARRFFGSFQRFPIADAHYAMGFAFLAESSGEDLYYRRAVHFLKVLKQTRCAGQSEYCWGYPFHWETIFGTIPAGTPLITTIPYVFEAFQHVYRVDRNPEWREILHSICRHVLRDYTDVPTSATASSCPYTPVPNFSLKVVNANAYRAFMLTNAAYEFSDTTYLKAAERNLNFVIEAQNADGSWFYAVDGKRNFVDHFHTCFVLKALAKIEALTGNVDCTRAIARGVNYYTRHLFDEDGIPKPFSRAPRFTVYRRELYDYAECINLATILHSRFPQLDRCLVATLTDVLSLWQTDAGSFRSRRLQFGWDNTPMHRWAAAQLFRSLCLVLNKSGFSLSLAR